MQEERGGGGTGAERETNGERERELLVPQVWQSRSCRKIPHGRRWESGVRVGVAWKISWLPLFICTSLPWKHICLLFCFTHLLLHPSLLFSLHDKDFSPLTAQTVFFFLFIALVCCYVSHWLLYFAKLHGSWAPFLFWSPISIKIMFLLFVTYFCGIFLLTKYTHKENQR